jgi:hypothetical protein
MAVVRTIQIADDRTLEGVEPGVRPRTNERPKVL